LLGTSGAILIYDITNSESLEGLPEFIQIIRKKLGNIPIILIGNKLDLKQSREVSIKEGIKFKEKYNLSSYLEISSKRGMNINNSFKVLTEKMILK